MKRVFALAVLLLAACASAASNLSMGPPPGAPVFLKDQPDEARGGIPTNFTQEKAGTFSVPNLLVSLGGKRITSSDDWLGTRRPEIRQLLLDNQFGMPMQLTWQNGVTVRNTTSERNVPALNGVALRTQWTITVSASRGSHDIDMVIYTPASVKIQVPAILIPVFSPNIVELDDTGIKETDVWDATGKRAPGHEARPIAKPDVLSFLMHGYAVATVYYGQIEPDFNGGAAIGLRKLFPPTDEGAVGVWADGLSLARDSLARVTAIDPDRIVLYGISRLGKAVLWAGANDPKFAAVIAVCSGEGGAALSRRKYGETIAHASAAFPHWFTAHWRDFAADPTTSPVDAHMILSLIAPRPLMIITADQDAWSDPYGEFLSARLATPVWRLFGKEGIDGYPPINVPTQGDLVFMTHAGPHGPAAVDTPAILGFLDRHLRR